MLKTGADKVATETRKTVLYIFRLFFFVTTKNEHTLAEVTHEVDFSLFFFQMETIYVTSCLLL